MNLTIKMCVLCLVTATQLSLSWEDPIFVKIQTPDDLLVADLAKPQTYPIGYKWKDSSNHAMTQLLWKLGSFSGKGTLKVWNPQTIGFWIIRRTKIFVPKGPDMEYEIVNRITLTKDMAKSAGKKILVIDAPNKYHWQDKK